MKKYTITEKEYDEMVEAMNTLTGENQKLRGFIDGMREQLIIGGVSVSLPTKDDACQAGFYKADREGYDYRRVLRDSEDDIYYSGWMDCFDWISKGNES